MFDLVASTRSTLLDLQDWQLTPEQWTRVDSLLTDLDAALSRSDTQALRSTRILLELCGPVRITRIGTEPTIAAPEHILERTNHLVHSLSLPLPPEQPARQEDNGDAGR
ncbi:CATRA system-associated protein [Allocatelliglobosispora scoriae]|nr:CATRA system-associated protein [Allocatelliglobosispora scoriae]